MPSYVIYNRTRDYYAGGSINYRGMEYASRYDDRATVEQYIANPERYIERHTNPNDWEIRVYVDNTWIEREEQRFDDGVYIVPVWNDQDWWINRNIANHKHFVHVSRSDMNNIAFTETPEKGMDNIKTAMKPGKYLTRFFADVLTKDAIQYWANKHRETYGGKSLPSMIRWVKEPDDIARVYGGMSAGFQSCMQHKKSKFPYTLPNHPAYAYGAGDLELAYICSDKDDTRLIARCLVWRNIPDAIQAEYSGTKLTSTPNTRVGRIYGDASLMRRELSKEGIVTESGSDDYEWMMGARMLKVPMNSNDNGIDSYLMPYVDGVSGLKESEDKEYFVLTRNNALVSARNTDGSLGPVFISDRSKKMYFNRSAYAIVVSGNGKDIPFVYQRWSEDEVRYAFSDSVRNNYFSRENYTPLEVYGGAYKDTYTICNELAVEGKDYFICDFSKEKWTTTKTNMVTMGNGEKWAHYYVTANAFMSSYDKKYYPVADRVIVGGRRFTMKQAKRLFYYDKTRAIYTVNKSEVANDDLFHNFIHGMKEGEDINEVFFKGYSEIEIYRGFYGEDRLYTYEELFGYGGEFRNTIGAMCSVVRVNVAGETDLYRVQTKDRGKLTGNPDDYVDDPRVRVITGTNGRKYFKQKYSSAQIERIIDDCRKAGVESPRYYSTGWSESGYQLEEKGL